MTQEIEMEYKNLLTEAEFTRLQQGLPFPEDAQLQVNHYFETNNFALKELGCALRIREKNGVFTSTLKEPHPQGLLETHDGLSDHEAEQWLNENISPKNNIAKRMIAHNIDADELIYYGSLTTRRRELDYSDVLLVLDYSTYHGYNDYELEIEAESEPAGLKAMHDIMKDFSINKRHTPNKIQRFFNSVPANNRHHKSD
ncbi:CYTH domain-containing protein [Lentibacillus jeotgali]|uniref:CYTH domain-containing protein n=1 Tax=Lentibacillus jeotgali TaxID=558169 RepID=UPI00026277FA|nr:CYTH domain-containing protein [Lentibacillus jeotgali]